VNIAAGRQLVGSPLGAPGNGGWIMLEHDLDQSRRPTAAKKWRMAFDPKQRAFTIQLLGFIVVTLSVAALVGLFFAL
jgi:hypothetical protein